VPVALLLPIVWAITDYWLLTNFLALCLAIEALSFVRLPNLMVSLILLSLFYFYDMFWVFFSAFFFGANVMVSVATSLPSLPVVLHFSSWIDPDRTNMLGLGDLLIPGMYLCFLYHFDLRQDALRITQLRKDADEPLDYDEPEHPLEQEVADDADLDGDTPLQHLDLDLELQERDGLILHGGESASNTAPSSKRIAGLKVYFLLGLLGYALGLYTAVCVVAIFQLAQPALIYLVPGILIPSLSVAALKGELGALWRGLSARAAKDAAPRNGEILRQEEEGEEIVVEMDDIVVSVPPQQQQQQQQQEDL